MKMLHLLLAVVGALSLGSCRKTPVANLTPDPQAPAPAVVTPEPLAPASLADAEPLPAALPHGAYFLRAAASVQTANGPVIFQPGTRLQQLSPNTYAAQGQTLTLRDDQVTRDPALARQASATDHAVQTGARREPKERPSDLAPVSPDAARQISTDPQYQALSERAAVLRTKIERVSREASRLPGAGTKTVSDTAALKKEREKLEGELQAITEQQNLLRTSK